MSVLAIIAEYNPYTNGHAYLLERAKKLTGADYSLAVMSGNFLQRGTAAMWDKYTRAEAAVCAGLDAVLELPFAYATGSARDFALGAVSLLNSLHSVDYLCFGAEAEDPELLKTIALLLADEPADYQTRLKAALSSGLSYPAAREEALFSCLNVGDRESFHALLSSPNNILAIEYLTALNSINSSIEPVIIKRAGDGYKSEVPESALASATAARADYAAHGEASRLSSMLPASVINVLSKTDHISAPVFTESLTPFLQQALLIRRDIDDIYGLGESTANKLRRFDTPKTYTEYLDALHTKELTKSGLSRGLLHLILGYTEADRALFSKHGDSFYAGLLALNKQASPLIKEIQEKSLIPVINLKKHAEETLSACKSCEAALRMWELDTKATSLFNCLVKNTYGTELPTDLTVKLPVI